MLPALNSGGVERGTLEVAAELVKLGHRSIVISAGGKLVPELTNAGSEHITWSVDRKSPFTLRHVRPFRRFLTQNKIDILHLRSRVPAWIAYLAWRKMNPNTRPTLVTTVHGLYSVSPYSAIMTKGQRVIAISEFVRQYILKNYPKTDPDNIRLIHRGADPEKFPRNHKPTQAWLNSLHNQYPQLKNNHIISLPGRLTRLKGHTDFIALIENLKPQYPNIQGLIVGAKDKRRAKYAQQLKQLVNRKNLTDNITFTGHRDDICDIYAISSIVLSLTSSPPEAFGRTAVEALSIGTPVIAYDQGGMGEILHHIYPKGAVPPSDLNVLTQRVSNFLQSPPAPPDDIKFTILAMLDKTIALYHELADQ